MVQDINTTFLVGRINLLKFGKSETGKEYATFSFQMASYIKEIADSAEKTLNFETYVRVFVYDNRYVKYLHDVGAKNNQYAFVFGRVGSFKSNYRGIDLLSQVIIARSIGIIKSSKNKEETK